MQSYEKHGISHFHTLSQAEQDDRLDHRDITHKAFITWCKKENINPESPAGAIARMDHLRSCAIHYAEVKYSALYPETNIYNMDANSRKMMRSAQDKYSKEILDYVRKVDEYMRKSNRSQLEELSVREILQSQSEFHTAEDGFRAQQHEISERNRKSNSVIASLMIDDVYDSRWEHKGTSPALWRDPRAGQSYEDSKRYQQKYSQNSDGYVPATGLPYGEPRQFPPDMPHQDEVIPWVERPPHMPTSYHNKNISPSNPFNNYNNNNQDHNQHNPNYMQNNQQDNNNNYNNPYNTPNTKNNNNNPTTNNNSDSKAGDLLGDIRLSHREYTNELRRHGYVATEENRPATDVEQQKYHFMKEMSRDLIREHNHLASEERDFHGTPGPTAIKSEISQTPGINGNLDQRSTAETVNEECLHIIRAYKPTEIDDTMQHQLDFKLHCHMFISFKKYG